MPYRRLPKTDQTRLAALQTAIKKGERDGINNPIVPLRLQIEAKSLLTHYQQALFDYRQSMDKQKQNARKHRSNAKLTRLYVSHFIQVLNMSIIRGEIKSVSKSFYGLNPDVNNVPDLTSDKALLEWGEKIIEGESQRVKNGGAPIYNPNIAKVKVYYDIFKENQAEQKIFQINVNRYAETVNKMRAKCDEVILDIWNEVETTFITLPWPERIEKGKNYGLIYYYRRGESIL